MRKTYSTWSLSDADVGYSSSLHQTWSVCTKEINMKTTVSMNKNKVRSTIVNCDFSQKEFLLFRKKHYVTFGRINKTELQNVIFIMAKKSFRDIIINVLGLLFFSIPGMVAGYPGWVFALLLPVYLIYMAIYNSQNEWEFFMYNV